VRDRNGTAERLEVGDIAWCPPGTVHWHGADRGSYMVHLVAAYVVTESLEEVEEGEYEEVAGRSDDD
jgi:quercetin dioxygenase-like cupin family protein